MQHAVPAARKQPPGKLGESDKSQLKVYANDLRAAHKNVKQEIADSNKQSTRFPRGIAKEFLEQLILQEAAYIEERRIVAYMLGDHATLKELGGLEGLIPELDALAARGGPLPVPEGLGSEVIVHNYIADMQPRDHASALRTGDEWLHFDECIKAHEKRPDTALATRGPFMSSTSPSLRNPGLNVNDHFSPMFRAGQ